MADDDPRGPAEDGAFHQQVLRTAYFLWEQDQRPSGRNEEYYLKALDIHRRRRDYDRWLEDEPPKAAG